MSCDNPTGRSEFDPAPKDPRTERAVLALLLHEYPTLLSLEELAVALSGDSRHQDPAEAAERTVRALVAAGLLHRVGALLAPTRAALHFDRLELG